MEKKQIANSQVISIDAGAGTMQIGYLDGNGQLALVPGPDGRSYIPTVIHLPENSDDIQVGAPAEEVELLEPKRTFRNWKRHLGKKKVLSKDKKWGDITAEFLTIQLLKAAKKAICEFFNDERAGGKLVLLYPPGFNDTQIAALEFCGKEAGFEVIHLMKEPTAAAVAFGVGQSGGDRLFGVMDFGHNTFDVSISAVRTGAMEVLTSHGDLNCGGFDVTRIIESQIEAAFGKEGIEFTPEKCPTEVCLLRVQAERGKHTLCSRTSVRIVASAGGKTVAVEINRQQFAKLVQALMDRCVCTVKKTCEIAKVDINDVTEWLLVGGSARLLPFQDAMKKVVGAERIRFGNPSPDTAACQGGIIKAINIVSSRGVQVVDKNLEAIPQPQIVEYIESSTWSSGVIVQDRVSHKKRCSVLIERNTPLPCKFVKQYGSVDPKQDTFQIQIVRGEQGQPAEECIVVGEKIVKMPAREPGKPSIEVIIEHKESDKAVVSIKDLLSGQVEDITLDFYLDRKAAVGDQNGAVTATSN